jgi:hypothetical protein
VFFVEDLDAEVDAFVADRAGWSGDDLADVAGALAAEGAAGEFAAQFALSSSFSSCLANFPGGFGELLECCGSGVKIGGRIVECGGEFGRILRSRSCQAITGSRGRSRRSSQGRAASRR